jgi:hypothetical protein
LERRAEKNSLKQKLAKIRWESGLKPTSTGEGGAESGQHAVQLERPTVGQVKKDVVTAGRMSSSLHRSIRKILVRTKEAKRTAGTSGIRLVQGAKVVEGLWGVHQIFIHQPSGQVHFACQRILGGRSRTTTGNRRINLSTDDVHPLSKKLNLVTKLGVLHAVDATLDHAEESLGLFVAHGTNSVAGPEKTRNADPLD